MVTNGYQYLQLDSNQNSLTITSIGKVKPTREMTLNVDINKRKCWIRGRGYSEKIIYIYIYIYIYTLIT